MKRMYQSTLRLAPDASYTIASPAILAWEIRIVKFFLLLFLFLWCLFRVWPWKRKFFLLLPRRKFIFETALHFPLSLALIGTLNSYTDSVHTTTTPTYVVSHSRKWLKGRSNQMQKKMPTGRKHAAVNEDFLLLIILLFICVVYCRRSTVYLYCTCSKVLLDFEIASTLYEAEYF